VRDHALPLVRAILDGVMKAEKLDAIVYPTASRRPPLISARMMCPAALRIRIESRNLSGFPT
jgi:hypothetical protein